MRLFIAVDLDSALRAAVADTIRAVQETLSRTSSSAAHSVKWVARENLHLTVRFIGHVDETRAASIQQVLLPPLSCARFDLALAGLGTFPAAGPPRIFWVGVEKGADRLAVVHRELEQRLKTIGVAPDERAFRAHLTVGRCRETGPRIKRSALSSMDVGAIGSCAIDHVTLYESHTLPAGPTYRAISRAPLAGRPNRSS